MSDLEVGEADATALQKRKPGPTTGIVLQEPDLNAICLVCLIGWASPNGLADPLGLEQLELKKSGVSR